MRHTRGHGEQRTVMVDGIRFWHTEQGYYLGNIGGKPKRLHIYVWERENGEIPKGYDIHHIDGDRENNDISNLQLLTEKEHCQLHSMQPERLEMSRKNIAFAIAKAPEWHKSEEGREWHKAHWERSIGKYMGNMVTKTCEYCGKAYEVVSFVASRSKFCGSNCKAKAGRRRKSEEKRALRCESAK